MAEFYVGGPVLRPGGELPPWVHDTYALLASQGLRLPYVERELEAARPPAFFEQILARIEQAGAIIEIFTGGDVNGAVEVTIASYRRKPVLIIAEQPSAVPRLLAGLPGVRVAAAGDNGAALSFLRENRGPEPPYRFRSR